MSSKRNAETINDLNKPYEQNEIGIKGIVWFAVGLFLLIVITFGLMWALLNVLIDYDRENAGPANPLAMNERDRLPPEPRLQAAPGFGVDSEKGRVNLELLPPQAEYRELHKQWVHMWEQGTKDAKTGTVIALSIEDAKQRLLQQGLKAKAGAEAETLYDRSRIMISDANSGRTEAGAQR
jgi:hypothetical protein